jgi:hypothetical protein
MSSSSSSVSASSSLDLDNIADDDLPHSPRFIAEILKGKSSKNIPSTPVSPKTAAEASEKPSSVQSGSQAKITSPSAQSSAPVPVPSSTSSSSIVKASTQAQGSAKSPAATSPAQPANSICQISLLLFFPAFVENLLGRFHLSISLLFVSIYIFSYFFVFILND